MAQGVRLSVTAVMFITAVIASAYFSYQFGKRTGEKSVIVDTDTVYVDRVVSRRDTVVSTRVDRVVIFKENEAEKKEEVTLVVPQNLVRTRPPEKVEPEEKAEQPRFRFKLLPYNGVNLTRKRLTLTLYNPNTNRWEQEIRNVPQKKFDADLFINSNYYRGGNADIRTELVFSYKRISIGGGLYAGNIDSGAFVSFRFKVF